MRNRLIGAMTALVMAGAISLSAQAPQNPALTITGCLTEKKGVTAATPNAGERAAATGIYTLTNVKMASTSPVSGIALGSVYQVAGMTEAELKKHLNHQVELLGSITQPTTPPNDNPPQFFATSLKMLAATCTAVK